MPVGELVAFYTAKDTRGVSLLFILISVSKL